MEPFKNEGMPKEDRRIIFDYDEVYKALYALCVQKNMKKPPAGRVQSVTADDDDPATIILNLVNPGENFDPESEVEYARDFLAAALMLACRGQRIPLPKTAQKSVMIKEDSVILRVQIG